MLKLKFDAKLDYQIEAINAVVDLFKGQVKGVSSPSFQVIPNVLNLKKEKILANLQEVQRRNNLELSGIEDLTEPYNFTIEMETGTGKTYIYLRTILELNKKYGFTKFIIVVPSVAIKEGVLKNLDITKEHFREIYDNIPYTYFPYSSDNLVKVRMFAQDTNLQIMVITKDAFNKDVNIIHNTHDKMGDKPIEIIKKTNPIVILDEPQKMEGEATKWGLSELNPLFILRYSATHREIHNLVYRLTPFDAYNLGLVKKIEVLSVTEEGDPSRKKIILESIDSLSSGLRAKVKVFVKEGVVMKFKTISIKHGDNLAKKTNNDYYEGFIVNEINKGAGYISFANGVKVYEGKSSVEEDEIVRIMIRETIREHFDKKKRLNEKGIKVLSLFFLNRVDDYLKEDGFVRKIFREEFKKLIQNDYTEFANLDVDKVHSGYFSAMKKEKSIEEDESAYDLIMKDKERLLSMDEPVEFIFSHSALREGWDNPNVFNICTLAYSTSEIKKRQEIGRGLRLAIDSEGNRVYSKDVNLLTVITNESYREYVQKLQTEFSEEVGEEAPPIENRRQRVQIKIKEDVLGSDLFERLWTRVAKKAKYTVRIDSGKFCEECIKEIQNIDLKSPKISIKGVLLDTIKIEEVDDKEHGAYKEVQIKTNIIKESSTGLLRSNVFNIVKFIEDETKLTRKTILKILKGANNLNLLFENPYRYAEKVVEIILWKLKEFEVENIEYYELDETFDLDIFNREIQTFDKYVLKVNKSIYDGVIKESDIEEKFAKALDADSRVKLFVKLPEQYKIETPAGNYTPDWLVVVERICDGTKKEEVYFVVETKGTNDLYDSSLRDEERIKIKSGERRFALVKEAGLKYIAPVKDYDSFIEKW
jgi:type III restriction enzyme